MNNFDSLTLKFFKEENMGYFEGAAIQKIQQPTRYELILFLRNFGINKRFYINIKPEFAHVCFIEKVFYNIPKNPPMFCMLLRKYLSNAKIKHAICPMYERILELYFDYIDELGEKSELCLALELMGKYSNVILYNSKTKIIIGSIHNVSEEKSKIREIYGGIPYIYPVKQEKKDIIKTSFNDFHNTYGMRQENKIEFINKNFYYLTRPLIEFCINKTKNDEELFELLKDIVSNPENPVLKEYFAYDFKSYNDLILNYYNKFYREDILNRRKKSLILKAKGEIKKLEKILNQEDKTSKIDDYKLYGDLILGNLYNIKQGDKNFIYDKYKIPLDKKLSPSRNAQKYYDLYKKAKNAQIVITEKKDDALDKIGVLKEKIFFIENAEDIFELEEENGNKESKDMENSINKVEYKGNIIYIGKNQKQNSYILSKIAKGDDFWFHAQGMPSCHILLKNPNKYDEMNDDILLYCARLTKENSPAKNSGKVPVIYTKRKYVTKQTRGIEGLVIYKFEKEIVIE